MVHYSYVKVDFWFPSSEAAEDFSWEHLRLRPDGEPKLIVPHVRGGEVVVVLIPCGRGYEAEFEEAQMGFSRDARVASLCRWLIGVRVPWKAYDGGGPSWPEIIHEWHPGDDRLYSKELSCGQTVLTEAGWRRALGVSDGDPDALVRIVNGHFGNDHHEWIQTGSPIEVEVS